MVVASFAYFQFLTAVAGRPVPEPARAAVAFRAATPVPAPIPRIQTSRLLPVSRLVPAAMLTIYRQAGKKFGVPWQLLAAVGYVESDHDRSNLPGVHSGINEAGCCSGPAQLCVVASCGDVWQNYATAADGQIDVYDPRSAFMTAARYLRVLRRQIGDRPALLLAAYNAGPSAVERYGGVPPYGQTEDYVRRGMTLIHKLNRAAV